MTTKTPKAPEAILNLLHDLTARDMLNRLQNGEDVLTKDEDGKPITFHMKGVSTATLGQIIKFLKDNGIEGVAEENTPLKNLAAELANIDADKLDELSDTSH